MAKKLKVAAYARVSTDKDDQVNSLVSQRKYFMDYINNHEEWQLVDVYYDEGISGTNTRKRAGFNEMIDHALRGEIDLILTKEVCRFARNTVDTLSYTRKLKAANVGVIFTIDNIDTRDQDGELRLTIMASIAQEESRKTSERVKWGQQRRMEQGVVFGRDMIGYTVRKGVLQINEEEVPIVRAVFHKYTNEGKGTTVIARELLEEGMRPKRISKWSNTIILKMLRNEKYVGDLCQKKTYTPDYLTHAKKYNHGEEQMVYLYDHHEPIIDRDLWNRTQEELRRRAPKKEQRMKYSNRYWCSGKIYCGFCGQRYVRRMKKLKCGEVYRAWRCYNAAEHGGPKVNVEGKEVGCNNRQVSEKALLTCMAYSIQLVQVNKAALKEEILKEIQQIRSVPMHHIDTESIKKQINDIRIKKQKLIDLVLEGLISKEDMKEQKDSYSEKILELESRLHYAEQEEKIRQRQIDGMQQYIAAIDEIMHFDESNQLLYREILDKVIIHKEGKVVIYLKALPFGIELLTKSHGKGENYVTEILEVRFLERQ